MPNLRALLVSRPRGPKRLEGYPIDEDGRIEPNRSTVETNWMRTVDRRFKCDGSIDIV